MNILLVYPHYPDTFWGFRHALKFIGRKASFPPLGLLTVAAMLPDHWDKKLIDLNVTQLSDGDISRADYVFISAMTIQRDSAEKVIARCRELGIKTVGGGPLFTAYHDQFSDVDHLVLGEAELSLPLFLHDLETSMPQHIYQPDGKAELADTPVPLWELADLSKYAAMNVQYSRGCPFDCEFCDITALFGRKPRTKSSAQLLEELESLYRIGWRGSIFFVDDNFIGDKHKLKQHVLPALIDWMERHDHPFYYYTEASIDLADDAKLTELMVRAGFREVFIGIETPDEEALGESGKIQNKNRDLLVSVKRLRQAGLQVHAGFIVGFDSDPPNIFETQLHFIQQSGIATAMVGVLVALRGTRLHKRLHSEGRLLGDASGNNLEVALNFVPKMNYKELICGYRQLLSNIYAPSNYYRRVIRLLQEYRPFASGRFTLQKGYLVALCKSILLLGILGKERLHFWRLVFWSIVCRPRLFPLAITYAIYGYHFRKVAEGLAAEEKICIN